MTAIGTQQLGVYADLVEEFEGHIKTLPPEAQKFYAQQTRDMKSAQKKGNTNGAKVAAELLQKRLHKMNNVQNKE